MAAQVATELRVPRRHFPRPLIAGALTLAFILVLTALGPYIAHYELDTMAIGKRLMRKPWKKIWPDFNPATGNYLLFGLSFLIIAPVLVLWLRTAI